MYLGALPKNLRVWCSAAKAADPELAKVAARLTLHKDSSMAFSPACEWASSNQLFPSEHNGRVHAVAQVRPSVIVCPNRTKA
jgi:hypothetical protein